MKTSLLFLIAAVFVGIVVNIGFAATPMHGSISISNTILHANQSEQITYTVSGGVPPYNYILYFSNSTSTVHLNYTSEVSPVFYFNFTAPSYISQNSVVGIMFAANDSEVPNETTGNVIGGNINEVANPPPNVVYSLILNNNVGLSPSTWIQSISPASISSSGYTYPMGTNVQIVSSLCIVNCLYGYIFSNWTGTGSGSVTGGQSFFITVTMNSNITETANYQYLNASIITLVSNTTPVTFSNFYNGYQTINLGQSVILYANASGGDGNYAYTWYIFNLSTDKLGQAVGQGTSFTASPTAIGDYAYCVIAREVTSGIKTNPYTCRSPVEITVIPSHAIPTSTTTVAPTPTTTVAPTPTTTVAPTPTTTTIPVPIPTTTAIHSNIVFQPVTINIQPGWNLLSLPVSEPDNWDYIFKSFSNNCGATMNTNSNNYFNIVGNLLWGYENPSNSYVSLSAETDLFNFLMTGSVTGTGNIGYFGVLGFWFNSPKQCSINTFAVSGGQYTTKLLAGWNIIGATEITSASFNSIASSCNLRGGFYAYNAIMDSYSAAATPTPGAGYFVYANAPCTLNWDAVASSSVSSSPPSVPK